MEPKPNKQFHRPRASFPDELKLRMPPPINHRDQLAYPATGREQRLLKSYDMLKDMVDHVRLRMGLTDQEVHRVVESVQAHLFEQVWRMTEGEK